MTSLTPSSVERVTFVDEAAAQHECDIYYAGEDEVLPAALADRASLHIRAFQGSLQVRSTPDMLVRSFSFQQDDPREDDHEHTRAHERAGASGGGGGGGGGGATLTVSGILDAAGHASSGGSSGQRASSFYEDFCATNDRLRSLFPELSGEAVLEEGGPEKETEEDRGQEDIRWHFKPQREDREVVIPAVVASSLEARQVPESHGVGMERTRELARGGPLRPIVTSRRATGATDEGAPDVAVEPPPRLLPRVPPRYPLADIQTLKGEDSSSGGTPPFGIAPPFGGAAPPYSRATTPPVHPFVRATSGGSGGGGGGGGSPYPGQNIPTPPPFLMPSPKSLG